MDATDRFEQRKTAIHLLRSGSAPADVASQLDRSLAWVYKWRTRFNETEDFQSLRERSRAPRSCPRRLDEGRCQAIKGARSELEAQAAAAKGLAYIGAQAVQARLRQQGLVRLPSTASIERVLRRAGMTRPRQRPAKTVDYPRMRPQVPHGLCQVDIVPHCLKAGPKLWCFNAIDVVSGYASGQSYLHKRAADACDFLVYLWKEQGIARYTQTDNEACFCGGFTHPYVLGQVLRLCLYVGTELVFSPHYHPKSNGYVERFHQDYTAHVWSRGLLGDLAEVNQQAQRFFVDFRHSEHQRKLQGKSPAQMHQQGSRWHLPTGFKRPAGKLPLTEGRVHFMRKVSPAKTVSILNVDWAVEGVEADTGVWATLKLGHGRGRLRIYDAAPDAERRQCLIEHAFPLKEQLHRLRPEFQRAQGSSLEQWARGLYRVFVKRAAVWLFSTMS